MYTKQHIMSLKGSDNMATAPTQIRIDSDVKNKQMIYLAIWGLICQVQ